jgi:hypothetical protein
MSLTRKSDMYTGLSSAGHVMSPPSSKRRRMLPGLTFSRPKANGMTGSNREPAINKLHSDVFEVLLEYLGTDPVDMISLALTSKSHNERVKSSKQITRLAELQTSRTDHRRIVTRLSYPDDMIHCTLRESIVPITSLPETHTHPTTAFCRCAAILAERQMALAYHHQLHQISNVQRQLVHARQARALQEGYPSHGGRKPIVPRFKDFPFETTDIEIERVMIERDLLTKLEASYPRTQQLQMQIKKAQHRLKARRLDLWEDTCVAHPHLGT